MAGLDGGAGQQPAFGGVEPGDDDCGEVGRPGAGPGVAPVVDGALEVQQAVPESAFGGPGQGEQRVAGGFAQLSAAAFGRVQGAERGTQRGCAQPAAGGRRSG
ncbi:hypothetical protein [Peterkaempfera bronchialis]|uniref:Uncharacterized protein n=1 Tax=Peterkaempfera bronchialis TaxID=2126346 RepID=A0A345SS26_9ACTN|nr:hypothetical protein [Peterkaempfera bronchialis]AXI76531.1 hypothetical protein C7M71_002635 [Peterkaempfera bronchialis]